MIQHTYDEMWSKFCTALSQNQYELDPHIHDPNDCRRGITALAYLDSNSKSVCQAIAAFLEQAKLVEPHQYYQPLDELHLTALSIISCYEGFKLSDINPEKYVDIFQEAMSDIEPIEVHFRGVTASPSCIVIQGFPEGPGLNSLRNNLRNGFEQSGLETSIDSRYRLITAHCSAMRFCSPLKNSGELLTLCEQYRNHNFGSVTFTDFELVFNNWYQSLSVTESLAKYSVG